MINSFANSRFLVGIAESGSPGPNFCTVTVPESRISKLSRKKLEHMAAFFQTSIPGGTRPRKIEASVAFLLCFNSFLEIIFFILLRARFYCFSTNDGIFVEKKS